MTRSFFRMLPVAALALGLFTAPVRAGDTGTFKVEDDAGLFSAAGIAKARGEFEAVSFASPTHLYVYTTGKIPADKQKDFDAVKGNADQRKRFFVDWARELVKSKDRKGDVFALIYKTDKAYMPVVVADEQSDVHGHFGDNKCKDIVAMFNDALKASHDEKLTGAAANDKMDAMLVKATERVISELKDRPVTAGKGNRTTNTNVAHNGDGGGKGIMGYVCIGLCVLLGVWLVIGLIRAFTGGGGGGMGGGGYGGGGGGGFMSSMLGGMFGAAAGMYLYDQFSGHSHSNDLGASNSYDNGGGNMDNGDGNFDGGSAGAGDGGGDWGGGGDAGGGDWGGDAGGGGDFGGGDW